MIHAVQKRYESQTKIVLSAALGGIIAFRAPVTGTIKSIRIIVTNAAGVTSARFNVKYDGTGIWAGTNRPEITSSVLDVEKTGLNVSVEVGKKISLDLEAISGGFIMTPIDLMMEIEDHLNDQKTATYTTESLANDATENGEPELAKAGTLVGLATDVPARVRVYATASERTADASREIGVDAEDGMGVFLDVVTTSEKLSFNLSPQAPFANMETSRTNEIPIAVQNRSGGASAVEVTFKYNIEEV